MCGIISMIQAKYGHSLLLFVRPTRICTVWRTVHAYIYHGVNAQNSNFSFFEIGYDTGAWLLECRSGESAPISLDESEDPWAYCYNQRTNIGVAIRMCKGGGERGGGING